MKIGSHVGMSGKEMMLGSVKEALSYGANTFMLYTGAPQNTRRKDVSELRVEEAWELMRANDITEFVVHAPYIINLANTVKPEIYQLAVDFLKTEIERTAAMGSKTLVLHPGSHVNAGADAGIDSIIKGLNEVLTQDTPVHIALETMAGKGSEVGRNFQELREIIDRVELSDKLGVCLDTCHIWDGGYNIVEQLDEVLQEFDQVIGLNRLKAVHLNDSMNPLEAHKDRHEKIGEGHLGIEAITRIINHPVLRDLPFILETPNDDDGYRREIALLRKLWGETPVEQ